MFISAKVFFDDRTANNTRLLIHAETAIPEEYIKRYKKNVVKITPMKTGALRRSVITQAIGNTAEISWRLPYARAQNEGGHYVPHIVRGTNRRDGGYGIIKSGYYKYTKYTTAGTGPHFANIAFTQTNAEMPSLMRELGLTK